jgi:Domain of unknown function (DUF4397)
MRTHRPSAILATIAVLALGAPPAPSTADPDTSALVRGAHFSPDTPSVDVYLTGFAGGTTTLALSNVGYGDVGNYQRLAPGQYTVSMRPAGADPSTPAALSWTLDAKPGQAFTAMAIGMHQSLQGRVLADDLTAPPPGQARVRVIQGADRAPKADITVDHGPVLGRAVPFAATTGYTNVGAGIWPVTGRSVDHPDIATTTNVTLQPGRVTTVVLLDAPTSGLSLSTHSDGVGDQNFPTGPVDAGGGATAQGVDHGGWMHIAAVALTAVALAATIVLLGAALRRGRPGW